MVARIFREFRRTGPIQVNQSLAGQLLVSLPDLTEQEFFRSVVILFRHDGEGATGLLLNRPTANRIGQSIRDLDPESLAPGVDPDDLRQFVFRGGPVQGPLMALHGSLAASELQVIPGVHFCVSARWIKQVVTQGRHDFRIFSGYCGWAPGQLEDELRSGCWLTCPAEPSDILGPDPGDLWHQLCERIGMGILFPGPEGGEMPPIVDPGLN